MSVQDRFNSTLAKADQVLAERTRRELAKLEREDAAEREEAREQARADALRRTEIAEKYDPAFSAHGMQTPQPIADESPGRYRRRLFETLQRRLPDANEWSDIRADDIPVAARSQIERMVIEAAILEGAKPSLDNLPRDGSMVSRTRVGEMGEKITEFFGKQSFIADMNRAGRKVLRLVDPRSGNVLWGRPFGR